MTKPDRVAAKKKLLSERERVSLVLPGALKAALTRVAQDEVRTLNQQCEMLLKRGLQEMGIQV